MTKPKSLRQLLAVIDHHIPIDHDVMIDGLSLDSREVKAGDLFVAYQGEKLDGKQFIAKAIANGAVAVLVDEAMDHCLAMPIIVVAHLRDHLSRLAGYFYDEPASKMTVIGVTGTNGKTTVCHLLWQIFTHLGVKTALISSLGWGTNQQPWAKTVAIDTLLSANKNHLTTPDPIAIQKHLAAYVIESVSIVVIEVSSHALAQKRVQGVSFDYAILTNITADHLDYHISVEEYANSKKLLFTMVGLRAVIVNQADYYGRRWLLEFARQLPTYSYLVTKSHVKRLADVQAYLLPTKQYTLKAAIATRLGQTILTSQLMGHFNLANILATLTLLQQFDVPWSLATAVIAQCEPIPGRLQIIRRDNAPVVIIDYAHTPDALTQVLLALKPYCHHQLYCVFGCGGNRDRGKRPQMAKVVEQYADHAIVTDDNIRFEASSQIISDIVAGFSQKASFEIIADRSQAIVAALTQTSQDDMILIAGKGHENYQQVGDNYWPFNEPAIVNQWLDRYLVENSSN